MAIYHKLVKATNENKNVRFELSLPKLFCSSVELVIQKDGEQWTGHKLEFSHVEGDEDIFVAIIPQMDCGLYFYHFCISKMNASGRSVFEKRADYLLTHGCEKFALAECLDASIKKEDVKSFQLTVYNRVYKEPEFLKGGLIYQIMVDRFYPGEFKAHEPKPTSKMHDNWYEIPEFRPVNDKILNNDFFGGTLVGVKQKLSYLKSLGVTCLYLNPIFLAKSNHKYDTADYLRIDDDFGTEKEFVEMLMSAKDYGMAVVLDGVFSHTGDDSVYFNRYGNFYSKGAYQSRESQYFSRYKFSEFPDKYDAWWGIETLPEINEKCPDYIDFICGRGGVINKWMKAGIAGFRLDVADELPDEFLSEVCAAVKRIKSDGVILGEIWEDASNKVAYSKRRKYLQGAQLDSVTNYVFKDAIIDFVIGGNASDLARKIQDVLINYPKEVVDVLMNVVGTHDTPRILTTLAQIDGHALTREERSIYKMDANAYEYAKSRLKIVAVLQYFLPGVPCLYYGDEVGVQGFEDPFNRTTYPWGREDKELLNFYKDLGALRGDCDELKSGDYELLIAQDNVFVFARNNGKRKVFVGVNVGGSERVEVDLDTEVIDVRTMSVSTRMIISANSFCIARTLKKRG